MSQPLPVEARREDAGFLRALTESGTPFLLVGGTAVAAYGCRQFAIDDLDILVDANRDGAESLAKCLQPFGYNLTDDQIRRLAERGLQMPLKQSVLYLEILTPIHDQMFDHMYARSSVGITNGLLVRVASPKDLIDMKSYLPDEKHRADVASLRAFITRNGG